MKTEITQLVSTNQLVNTPTQVVCINTREAISLTKSNSWDNDNSLEVNTIVIPKEDGVKIVHEMFEDGENVNDCTIKLIQRNNNNALMITEYWESWEDEESIILEFNTPEERQEVQDYLVNQLTAHC